MNKEILIECTPLKFYCYNDEVALFDWLAKIQGIQQIQGSGKILQLYMHSEQISTEDLINLLGIFKRYKFKNIQQLTMFINEDNSYLFT